MKDITREVVKLFRMVIGLVIVRLAKIVSLRPRRLMVLLVVALFGTWLRWNPFWTFMRLFWIRLVMGSWISSVWITCRGYRLALRAIPLSILVRNALWLRVIYLAVGR